MSIESSDAWLEQLKNGRSFLLISHISPDGDTIGSVLALRLALLSLGKKVSIVCDGVIPAFIPPLPGLDDYLKPEEVNGGYDTAIAVDVSAPELMGNSGPLFEAASCRMVVDHHATNPAFGDINWIRRGESACCQIIYDAVRELGIALNRELAECLLLGLSTDTGHFQYSSTTALTMETAAALVDAGADISRLTRYLYRSQSMSKVRLTKLVYSKMHFADNEQIGMVELTMDDVAQTGASKEDMDGLVNIPLEISGVRFAFLASEQEKGIKISLRAMEPDTVNDVAAQFGGGGHAQAAGCTIRGLSLYEAAEKVLQAIEAKL
jgi:phosphoesterase RecJ-like protein